MKPQCCEAITLKHRDTARGELYALAILIGITTSKPDPPAHWINENRPGFLPRVEAHRNARHHRRVELSAK